MNLRSGWYAACVILSRNALKAYSYQILRSLGLDRGYLVQAIQTIIASMHTNSNITQATSCFLLRFDILRQRVTLWLKMVKI